MEKLDLKKVYKELYNPPKKEPAVVTVPAFRYLMIEGENAEPSNPLFQQSIQLLFSVSYKAKFIIKKKLQKDYAVMPLQGLWWANDMEDFLRGNKLKWKWNLMILQPELVLDEHIDEAREKAKSDFDAQLLECLNFRWFEEKHVAQIMHIGPYSEEHDNIMKVHNLIETQGGTFNGKQQKHHEIYLSDFRKTAPEKLRTIIRQPFTPRN